MSDQQCQQHLILKAPGSRCYVIDVQSADYLHCVGPVHTEQMPKACQMTQLHDSYHLWQRAQQTGADAKGLPNDTAVRHLSLMAESSTDWQLVTGSLCCLQWSQTHMCCASAEQPAVLSILASVQIQSHACHILLHMVVACL